MKQEKGSKYCELIKIILRLVYGKESKILINHIIKKVQFINNYSENEFSSPKLVSIPSIL